MARRDSEEIVTQSVLDRLTDSEPLMAVDAPVSRAQSVRQLKTSLRRDLEWLLNTRRTPDEAGPEFQELQQSVYNYGLPDITSMSVSNVRDRDRLLVYVESTIATYEPRLEAVKITPIESISLTTRTVRFQIEGMLKMDPAPEHVSFDTVLQLSSGEYQVKGEQSAR